MNRNVAIVSSLRKMFADREIHMSFKKSSIRLRFQVFQIKATVQVSLITFICVTDI